MRSSLVAVLVISACYTVCAQGDSASTRPSWFLSLHSGALVGRTGTGTTSTTAIISGVRIERLSFGVGAGYDTYLNWETLPVFASASYDVIQRQHHSFFVQVNTGYVRAWYRHRFEEQFNYDSEGGFFYHPQLGCRLHQGKFTLYFSAGYKLQRLTYSETPRWWTMTRTGMSRTVVQDMERLSISIGVGLW